MDINYKITDTKQYCTWIIHQITHDISKETIPYNLAHRICTIVNTDYSKEKNLQELRDLLIKRGFPKDLINNGITKAKTVKQDKLRIT